MKRSSKIMARLKEIFPWKPSMIAALLIASGILVYLNPRFRMKEPYYPNTARSAMRFRREEWTPLQTFTHRYFGENVDSCPYYGKYHGLFHPKVPHPRFIVTGGAGFIGSHLVKSLREQYQASQIKVLDNLWQGQLANLQYENGSWAILPSEDFCLVDLRNEAEALKFIRGADVIFHLAAIVGGIDYSLSHERSVFRWNVLINSNTIYASKVNRIANFIYTSTACNRLKLSEENGETHQIQYDDKYAASSETSYDWSKLLGEYELELSESDHFNYGTVRLHNVYGPYSNFNPGRSHVIPSLIYKVLISINRTSRLVVWGSGKQYRDFIYIDDVIDALRLMLKRGLNHGSIQIGTGKSTTIAALAETITEAAEVQINKRFNVTYDATQPEGDGGRVAKLDRATHLLGWKAKVTLKDGIATTLSWMQNVQSRQRVLVIAIGQSRGGDLAWKSLHKYLLRPLNAHLAIYVSNWQPKTLLKAMSQYIWTIPEYQYWDVVFEKIVETCLTDNVTNRWRAYCHVDGMFMGGIKYCSHPASASISLAFRWLVQQKILELGLLEKYDWFILTRADELYLCDHYPFFTMNKDHILLPIGEYYGGWSDRHIIGKSTLFISMLNITTELVCRPDYWYREFQKAPDYYNLEKLQKFMWSRMNISVSEFPRSMFIVRAPNDTTRWTQGNVQPDLEPFNLKLKYPEELAASMKHCQIHNLTNSLNIIQQYNWQI